MRIAIRGSSVIPTFALLVTKAKIRRLKKIHVYTAAVIAGKSCLGAIQHIFRHMIALA
jgi:hypothetical protein